MFRWQKSVGVTRKPECCVGYLDDPMVTQNHDYAPGQIVAFVICPAELESQSSQILAVVKTCGFLHQKGSVFSTIWKQDFEDTLQTLPSLVLVNVDCIVRHCLMIPTDNDHSCYQEIWRAVSVGRTSSLNAKHI
jgi:hypothetical protein